MRLRQDASGFQSYLSATTMTTRRQNNKLTRLSTSDKPQLPNMDVPGTKKNTAPDTQFASQRKVYARKDAKAYLGKNKGTSTKKKSYCLAIS